MMAPLPRASQITDDISNLPVHTALQVIRDATAQLDARVTTARAVADQAASDTAGGAQKVSKSGDTMFGPLVLAGAPTAGNQAASKAYVDAVATGQTTGNMVPVEKYGALGDGVTDCTDAIAAAWADAIENGVVPTFQPGRRYYVARPCYAYWPGVVWLDLGASFRGFPMPTQTLAEWLEEYDVYLDAARGSDLYSGLTKDRPKRTLTAAVAALPATAPRLGIARGSIYNDHFVAPVSGALFGAYGVGPKPQIRASEPINRPAGSWTRVGSTNEYTTPCNNSPDPVTTSGTVWYYPNGNLADPVMLLPGTSGSLAVGAYEITGSSAPYTLRVNVGGSPAGVQFEISLYSYCVVADGVTDVTVRDLALRHSGNDGISFKNLAHRMSALRVQSMWVGNDSINCFSPCLGAHVRHCELGRTKDGDGFSMHGAAGVPGSGLVESCYFKDAGKDWVTNAEGNTFDVIGNFIEDCDGAPVYNDPSYVNNGVHRLVGNIYTGASRHADASPAYFFADTGHSQTLVYLYNNTLYRGTKPGLNQRAMRFAGATVKSRNNVIVGYSLGYYTPTPGIPVDSDYDDFFNCTTPYLNILEGTHSKRVDPKFVDAPSLDFRLGAGSPLIATGQAQAGVIDAFTGAAPDFGALYAP
jgi:hypothetical protein